MSYRYYDDPETRWERRLGRVMRSREGFAWGAFLLGFFIGALIF